jgi:CBS domain-containing protein
MQTPIVRCSPDTPLHEVAELMATHRIHCVATDTALVTDLDVIRAGLTGDQELPVSEIAAGEVVAVEADDTLDMVARRMTEHEVAHVVVVAQGRPVGIISTLDLAAALAA